MITLVVKTPELFDQKKEEFVPGKKVYLHLEHSLLSISKWESRWRKPFLSKDEKSRDETIDYIRCMTLDRNIDETCYTAITDYQIEYVTKYINENMTATTFKKDNGPKNREIITSEVIYYWMVEHGIPFECQKWHFSRLMTLINVCNIKRSPSKKMSKKELAKRNSALNAKRCAMHKTKG